MRRRLLFSGIDDSKYTFTAQETSKTIESDDNYITIAITSKADGVNTPFEVVSYDTPITSVTTAATSVTIRYSENTTTSERTGTVMLKQTESNKTITITLTQDPITYVFSSNTQAYVSSCGSDYISVESTVNKRNTPYTVVSYDGVVTGVTTANTYIDILCDENTTTSERTGTVTLKQTESDNTITINVTQSAVNYTFTASTSTTINGTTTSTTHYVTSYKNCNYLPYTVVSYDGVVTGVTTADTYITILCDENTTTTSRSGTVTLKQTETDNTITINVTQRAIVYRFTASTTSTSVTSGASSTQIRITSTKDNNDQPYTVESYNGPITSVTTAATSVTISYSENNNGNTRSGNVVLKQAESNNTITITVNQSGVTVTCEHQCIVLNGTSSSTGNTTLNVTDGTVTSKPSWVTATNSNGTFNVTASSSNSDSSVRSGDITISWTNQTKTITILQFQSDYLSKEYVNIGGANWGTKNVGASSPTDYGGYYKYGAGTVTGTSAPNYTGKTNPLPVSADTATQVLGSNWRMPTSAQCQSLVDQTTHYYSSYNNVNGQVATNGTNAIFFPMAGSLSSSGYEEVGSYFDVWTCTPMTVSGNYAHTLRGSDTNFVAQHNNSKQAVGWANSVRGIHT